MRPRVLIVTRWFPPEQAPFGQMMSELARYLASRGFSVDVVTSVPSHPAAVVFEGWRNRPWQVESDMPGLRVLRLGTVARRARQGQAPPGWFVRAASFLWFTVAAGMAAVLLPRPEVIFAVLQPLTIGPLIRMVARLRGARTIFNVQDLHPDALVDLGLIRNPLLVGILRRIERTSYRRADGLAVICEGFRDHCVALGAIPDRIRIIPNWIDLDAIRPQPASPGIRADAGLLDADFVALYAGTIGLVSGAEVVVEAASNLGPDAGVHFLFVGEGQLVPRLRERARAAGLRNVRFLPFQDRGRLNDVQSSGDVSLVTLLPGQGRTSVPSKVLGYMAAGRPVIAAVDADSETARFLNGAGAGVVVRPGDPAALADALKALRDSPGRRQMMGRSGRRYLEEHCSQEEVLRAYADMFESVAAS